MAIITVTGFYLLGAKVLIGAIINKLFKLILSIDAHLSVLIILIGEKISFAHLHKLRY